MGQAFIASGCNESAGDGRRSAACFGWILDVGMKLIAQPGRGALVGRWVLGSSQAVGCRWMGVFGVLAVAGG